MTEAVAVAVAAAKANANVANGLLPPGQPNRPNHHPPESSTQLSSYRGLESWALFTSSADSAFAGSRTGRNSLSVGQI